MQINLGTINLYLLKHNTGNTDMKKLTESQKDLILTILTEKVDEIRADIVSLIQDGDAEGAMKAGRLLNDAEALMDYLFS